MDSAVTAAAIDPKDAPDLSPCQACGACCAYSADWPRFALESDAAIAMIPQVYVDDARGAMRCIGDRCSALVGEVGVATACRVYAVRADVCRECEPGDAACTIARARFRLPPIAVP